MAAFLSSDMALLRAVECVKTVKMVIPIEVCTELINKARTYNVIQEVPDFTLGEGIDGSGNYFSLIIGALTGATLLIATKRET